MPGLLRSLPLPHSPMRSTYAQMAQGPRRRARQVARVRSGVRAMPPRTQAGKAPLAGRVPCAWLDAGAATAPHAAEPGSSCNSAAAVRSGRSGDAAAGARAASGSPPGASGRPRERAEDCARLDMDASASDSDADSDSAAGLGAELPELIEDQCGRAGRGRGMPRQEAAARRLSAAGGGGGWWRAWVPAGSYTMRGWAGSLPLRCWQTTRPCCPPSCAGGRHAAARTLP